MKRWLITGLFAVLLSSFSAGAFASAPVTARDWFEQGTRQYDNQDYEQAIASYTRVIELRPDFADAYLNRGVIYSLSGRHEQAIADANKAVALAPQSAPSYGVRGSIYEAAGRYNLAFADYNTALGLEPTFYQLFYKRGQLYQLRSQYDAAIADYTRGIAVQPEAAFYYARAEAYYDKSAFFDLEMPAFSALMEHELAAADLKTAHAITIEQGTRRLQVNPTDAEALLLRGQAYLEEREYDKAQADFDRLAALVPGATDWRELAATQRKEYEAAGQHVEAAAQRIAADPLAADAYAERAVAYAMTGQYKLANADRLAAATLFVARYTDKIAANPNDYTLFGKRGQAYLQKKAYAPALADFNAAIRLAPDRLEAYRDRALAYIGLRQFGMAERELRWVWREAEAGTKRLEGQHALEEVVMLLGVVQQYFQSHTIAEHSEALLKNPRDAQLYNRRGVAGAHGAWKLRMAMDDFDTAIALAPDYKPAYLNRGKFYMSLILAEPDAEQQQLALAIADFNTALQLDQSYAEAYANRGLAHSVQGKYELAIADFQQAIRLNRRHAVAYFGLAQAYEQQGRAPEAVEAYRAVIRHLPAYETSQSKDLIREAAGIVGLSPAYLIGSVDTYIRLAQERIAALGGK